MAPALQQSTSASSTNRISKCPECLRKERDAKGKEGSDKEKDKD